MMHFNLFPSQEKYKRDAQKKWLLSMLLCCFLVTSAASILKFLLFQQTQTILIQQNNISREIALIPMKDINAREALLEKMQRFLREKKITDNKNQQLQTILSAIANQIPDSITLDTFSLSGNKLQLSAYSANTTDIHTYTNTLQNTLKKNLTIKNIEKTAPHLKNYHFLIQEK